MELVKLSALPDAPIVSIVIPSFNQGKYIKETIDAILSQDYRPIEVIVMDGASTDQTVEILKTYEGAKELHWVSEPDGGVVDAVNKGLKKVKGQIVAIQSSDDIYKPYAFSTIVDMSKSHPDVGFIYGEAEYIDAESKIIGKSEAGAYSLCNFLTRDTFVLQSSAFFRREFIAVLGGWRPEYSYAPDNDYWMKICLRTKVLKLGDILSSYRYHEDQRDKEGNKPARDWERMIRESKDIRSLSFNLRRAATAGIYRTKLRYISEDAWIRRHLYAYASLMSYPKAVLTMDRRDFIPAYRPIRKLLSKLKRFVLSK